MKRFWRWHGTWMLVMAVWGLSVGGNGQWSDRRDQYFHPVIVVPHGPAPGGAVASRSTGWAGDGRANGAEPDAGLWPAAGADGQYRAIDACRYDEELQREHDLILCEGHRVLWRFGEQLRQEAIDYVRWSAAGGVVGRTVRTALKSARQTARIGHDAIKQLGTTVPPGITVLGHYPAYTELAEQLGARRFSVPLEAWSKMTPTEQWAANQKFLDRMIARGDTILLATPLDKVKPKSFFERELKYLHDKGFKPSVDGSRLILEGLD